MLRLIDIALLRNGKQILHDLNLEVVEGEVHAVLGLNGAGKSTLAAVVMGLGGYSPSSGRILFRGEEITRLPVHERARRGITLAWQEPARFEGLTVAEYLRVGQRRDRTVPLGPRECLAQVGLPPEKYLTRAVDVSLSGGERKRVELASVLAMNPVLAILDEPDSGIDILSVSHIVDVIRTLAKTGSAVLLITHHEEVAATADRASSLCGGTILRTGEPQAIARFFRNHCQECPLAGEPMGEALARA
jgi:Fe-S cluster assembly ATP-binding protein